MEECEDGVEELETRGERPTVPIVTSSDELDGRPHEEQKCALSSTGALQEGQVGMRRDSIA